MPEYLTVSQVSARLGISERAVQKRCASGKLEARRVETPQGTHWEIEAAQLARTGEPDRRTGEPKEDAPPNIDAHEDANRRTEGPEPTNEPANVRTEPDAMASTLLAQLQSENAFLRLAVEQHQRSEAELRAALRKALEAMPKQLTEGAGGSTPVVPNSGKLAEVGAQKEKEGHKLQQVATVSAPTQAGELGQVGTKNEDMHERKLTEVNAKKEPTEATQHDQSTPNDQTTRAPIVAAYRGTRRSGQLFGRVLDRLLGRYPRGSK